MSTSCNIAVEREDGTFLQSRVNWDGYPDHMLEQLEHWSTQKSAEDLCGKGDIRTLYADVAELYSDATFVPVPRKCPVKDEDYLYVFRNGVWAEMTESKMDSLLAEIFEFTGKLPE